MRKLITIFLLIFALGVFTSCGQDAPMLQTQTTYPGDMTGSWRGVDSHGEQRFKLDIADQKVEIDWVFDDGDTALYWIGTFPTTTENFVSDADLTAMEHSVLASQSTTKEFTHDHGALTFSVTALGLTRTIYITK